jgi:hypothetical protein
VEGLTELGDRHLCGGGAGLGEQAWCGGLIGGYLEQLASVGDDALLRALRDKLTGDKWPIAVRTLSQAALDPRFGAHVRVSLYVWARTSRSQADLVAGVCGGAFGDQHPEMALVRPGWAAQNSLPDSPALASAVASLAARHPDAVRRSIAKWFDDDDRLAASTRSWRWPQPARGRHCCAGGQITLPTNLVGGTT